MKRKPLLISVVTFLIVLLTIEIGILTSYVSNFVNPAFKPLALPLLGILALVTAGLTIWLYFLQRDTTAHTSTQNILLTIQNRRRMLAKVRYFWIKSVLEQSLHSAALIALGLHERPDAVENPWKFVLQQPDQPAQPLPPGTLITQVYDDADGELLILGEPGSGKTTLLLQLARDLLDRADIDDTLPMPVVFNLSSWSVKRRPLADWLVDELNTKYQVPRKIGQLWMNTCQVLPLLDGLDEVAKEQRAACVDAINTYRREQMVPTVVCSRSTEYLTQTRRAFLRCAVVIQPLTAEQIDDYLWSAGGQLEAVRLALNKDKELQELAANPLMLSVLALAYHDTSIEGLLAGESPETRRRQVFATYIQRMLQRRSAETHYTAQQTMHWLIWLAQQLVQYDQSVFYIEHVQPDGLQRAWLRRTYEFLTVRLIDILIGVLVSLVVGALFLESYPPLPGPIDNMVVRGIVGGLIGMLLSKWKTVQWLEVMKHGGQISRWYHLINSSLWRGLIFGLIFGLYEVYLYQNGQITVYGSGNPLYAWLIFGLSLGVSCSLFSAILYKKKTVQPPADSSSSRPEESRWRDLITAGHLRSGLLFGGSVWLSSSIEIMYVLNPRIIPDDWGTLIFELSFGLHIGLVYALVGFLLSAIIVRTERTIQPVEIINVSLRSLWNNLINANPLRNGILIGILVGLIYGLVEVFYDQTGGLTNGTGGVLVFGLYLYSLENALSLWLSAGLSAGLSYWLLFGLFNGLSGETLDADQRVVPNQGIRRSAQNGLLIGFISGLVACFICILSAILFKMIHTTLLIPGSGLGVSEGLQYGLGSNLSYELIAGIAGGILVGVLTGGRAFIQHIVLRLFLWHEGHAPLNYPRFLDYTAERILLRKVGGSYIFIHRLLLEHFASLDTLPTSNK